MAVVNLAMSPLRRRNCFLVLAFVVFLPFCVFVLFSVPDSNKKIQLEAIKFSRARNGAVTNLVQKKGRFWPALNVHWWEKTRSNSEPASAIPSADVNSEQMLTQRLAELQVKLQYLDTMYRARQEDLQQLTQHIDQSGLGSDNMSSFTLPPPELRPEIRQILKNMSGMNAAAGLNLPIKLRLPSSYHFLPHLLDDPSSLRLAYLLSKGRSGVSVVLGVPTVRREKQCYLMETLQNLVEGMSPKESNDTVIVIFVAETDLGYVLQIAKDIEMRFPSHVESGLIEVISPSPAYYPNLDKLRITLGDSPERVRWRSKQNLDFAFLMSYCQPKGTFYVQLEDDILAKPSYVTEMKEFALSKIARKEPWFVLDFCRLGFIGKMFKSAELPWLIQFFQMFYNDKPVDWLLYSLIYTKLCNIDKSHDYCKRDKAKLWIHYKPSLFQHIGTHSSLKGKVQKLKVQSICSEPPLGTTLQYSRKHLRRLPDLNRSDKRSIVTKRHRRRGLQRKWEIINVNDEDERPKSRIRRTGKFLQDRQFGKVALFFPHKNPEAEVFTGMKHYKQYTLESSYLGENFFWGLLPSPGDQLVFKFVHLTSVKRFFFRSGNAEHPADKFYNTTVEVLPAENNQYGSNMNVTSDGFIIVGKFDDVGIAQGTVDESLGPLQALRLFVHSETENWAILSEIYIQDEFATR